MEVFICVFREKFRNMDFRSDFQIFFGILSIFGAWVHEGYPSCVQGRSRRCREARGSRLGALRAGGSAGNSRLDA